MALVWDPKQYARFGDHRGHPYLDLLARIGADAPRRVVDLGCGPGNLTALCRQRWPAAHIVGLDSSPDMIEQAREIPGVRWELGDVSEWRPTPQDDVVLANAVLQWLPEHRELLRRWTSELAPGSWLAWQVPGNFDSPSHTLMRELAASPRWSAQLDGVLRHDHPVDDPIDYARLLQSGGWVADAWETTYVQVLTGPDPVLEWVRGTGLRPVLQALGPADAAAFETEYAAAVRQAYPPTPAGTLFPFRRIFAVGVKP